MRSVAGGDQTALQASYTEPTYLILLELDETLHLSSRGTVNTPLPILASDTTVAQGDDTTTLATAEYWPSSAGTLEWTGGQVGIRELAEWRTVSIELANADHARTAYLMTGDWRGNACQVSLLLASDALLLLFSGSLEAAPGIGNTIELIAGRVQAQAAQTPRRTARKPVFSHLRPAGAIVSRNSILHELETPDG